MIVITFLLVTAAYVAIAAVIVFILENLDGIGSRRSTPPMALYQMPIMAVARPRLHVFMSSGDSSWICKGCGRGGFGETPIEAYRAWEARLGARRRLYYYGEYPHIL